MQHKITPDEFQDWRDHPITQWVFEAIRKGAEAQRAAWIDASWGEGASWGESKSDPMLLCELRTRADAYMALVDTPFERWSELHEHPDA
jgi:hypothetical protein